MILSVTEKETTITSPVHSIANYSFSECLNLLKKLQQLDSLVLQSAYYQYIIATLEERIKGLAQHEKSYLPSSYPVYA